MKSLNLKRHLGIEGKLKKGSVKLYGNNRKEYVNEALYVPGYGWVPCSRKLLDNFTTDSKDLMLVISDAEDSDRPVTSDIWITLENKVTIKVNW